MHSDLSGLILGYLTPVHVINDTFMQCMVLNSHFKFAPKPDLVQLAKGPAKCALEKVHMTGWTVNFGAGSYED